MLEIDKDTKRTWSSMHFFAVPCQVPEVLTQKGPSRQQVEPDLPTFQHALSADLAMQGSHQQCIARALFVYARLNPGIRYVQGMNELIAPMCASSALAFCRVLTLILRADITFSPRANTPTIARGMAASLPEITAKRTRFGVFAISWLTFAITSACRWTIQPPAWAAHC